MLLYMRYAKGGHQRNLTTDSATRVVPEKPAPVTTSENDVGARPGKKTQERSPQDAGTGRRAAVER